MTRRDTIHRHARNIADGELHRCRPLRTLPAEEATLVAEAVRGATDALADCLLEQARTEPWLYAALETIYGADGVAPLSGTSGVSAAETAA